MTDALRLLTPTQARRHLGLGLVRWRRLAPTIPAITDPETGQRLYSLALLTEWQQTAARNPPQTAA